MIPTKLRLHNFMSYADAPALDLRGIHLACLAGENGHGKSALLDAITWALWGKARARNDNDLIRQGEGEMEVEIEFELYSNLYRVLRKRSGKGAGRTVLELQVRAADGFRVLTETSVRATEARIVQLLRMDYETFVNSAYLQQGKADVFTTMPPASRKAILAQILGLDAYEEFEARAKELLKDAERQADAAQAQLGEIERELARLPEIEALAQTAQGQVADLALRLRTAEAMQRATEEQRQVRVSAQRELDDLARRLAQVKQDMDGTQRDLAGRRGRLDAFERLLAQPEEIEQGYAALQAARQAEAGWQQRALDHARRRAASSELEATIARARGEIESRQRVAQARLADLQTRRERAVSAQQMLQQAQADLARLDGLQVERAAAEAAQREAGEERARLEQVNKQLKQEMDALKERLDDLEKAEANCPLCRQPLSSHDHQRVLAEFRTQGLALGDQHRANVNSSKALHERQRQLQEQVARLDIALRQRPAWERQKAQAETTIAEATQAQAEAVQQEQTLAQLAQQLTQRDYASASQVELAALQAEMAAAVYDAASHAATTQQVAALAGWEPRWRELARAQEEHAGLAAQVGELEQRLARWQAAAAADQERADALREAVAELPGIHAQLRQQGAEIKALESQLERAQQNLGAARQQIETCRRQAVRQVELTERRQKLNEERAIYDELKLAFGKKGVPAMIIEAAIPEIEEEANRLLGRMTDQRMSVQFQSQRDTKKGDTIETLDIIIRDELGVRPYEMYSGGEAFRTNLAIRIALSKLLARRAGARLQTLIIDEGFGTQDTAGRERLVEAITSIQQDFERILVVTHIEELKDQFPVRINVVKGAGGSSFSIS
ncbi:MAG: SMC family ATPase [Anaerolineae bacterium]